MSDDDPTEGYDHTPSLRLDARRDLLCEYAGHEWVPAGGGLLICAVCEDEKWATSGEQPGGGGWPTGA